MQTKKLVYIDQTSFDNGAKYIWGYLRGCCIVKGAARIIVIDAQKQRKSQIMMAFNGNVNK